MQKHPFPNLIEYELLLSDLYRRNDSRSYRTACSLRRVSKGNASGAVTLGDAGDQLIVFEFKMN